MATNKKESRRRIRAVTAIILAGGKSSRFGEDKAFFEIGGEPLVKTQIDMLKRVFKSIIISTNSPERYGFAGIELVRDAIRDYGPLAGMHAGLSASGTFKNFVVACDMPFLNEKIIRYIISRSKGYDIVVSKIDDELHPLFGVYSKNCIPVIEGLIEAGLHRVADLCTRVKTRFISKKEIEGLDNDLNSLVNINTKEEFDYLLRKGGI